MISDPKKITNRLYENVEYLLAIHDDIPRGYLERAIGVSTGYISRTKKNGDFDLPITKVVAIAEYFGIELNDLIYGNYKKAYLIMQGAKIAKELKEMEGEQKGE